MKRTQKMMQCAMLSALIALCAWLTIPIPPIGFTMQTFAVFLTLGLLGGKWGSISIFIYLLLGAVGLPVFSGFHGGISALLGPTGGFLFGFLAAGLIYGFLSKIHILFAMVTGLLVCYAFGCLWYCVYFGSESFFSAVALCVLPYAIPDVFKICLAYQMTKKLRRILSLVSR